MKKIKKNIINKMRKVILGLKDAKETDDNKFMLLVRQ